MNEMKRQITVSFMIAAATVLLLLPRSTVTAQVQDKAAATALKAAIDKETLEGNPKSAIEQYKKIAESKDRSVAAQALMHLAELYRKLGDTESRRIYERIVKDFADQKEPFALAQARLGGTGQSTGPVSRTLGPFPGSEPGTLSRDGRFFSYSDRRDVFIHEIATGVDRKLTNQPSDSKDIAFESVISPDGKRIAYTWYKAQEKRYDLRLANLTGGPNPRQLYDNPDIYDIFLADWSPDGKWLAVEVQRVDKKIAQIGLVSVSDGSLRVLKSIDWSMAKAVRGMYFSPDGKYLGYDLPLSNTSQERDVYALAVDGSREIPVIKQPGSDEMVGWSPDGKWLLFKSNHTAINLVAAVTGQADLWAIAFIDGKPQGMPQPLRANVGTSFRPMGWTVSGALYYQANNARRPNNSKVQLASLDFTTGKFVSLPMPLTRGYQENTSSPLWSPDGKRLAYLSELQDRGVNNDELVIWAPETGTIRELRIKQLGAISSIFAWAPDGTSLMVDASDLRDRRGIFRVDAETGDASVVVLSSPDINYFGGITWMHGGLSFLSVSTVAKRGLYRVDTQTGVPALVLEQKGPLDMFFPSPNGKTLYYTQSFPKKDKPAGAFDFVFIERDLATGDERELIRKDHALYPMCSPDGQYCAITTSDAASNSRVLLLLSSSGGEPPRELLRLPTDVKPEDLSKANVGPWIRTLSWTADSRSLLVRKVDPNKDDELWLVSVDGQQSGKVQHPRVPEILPSPDNRYAAYRVLGPATTEVSVLENFLPKTTPASK